VSLGPRRLRVETAALVALAILQYAWGDLAMSGAPALPRSQLLSQGALRGRVQKITLDAGLTCPNRDGRVGMGGCLYCNARGSGTGAWGRGQSITEQLAGGHGPPGEALRGLPLHRLFPEFFQYLRPGKHPGRNLYQEALAFPEVVGLSLGTRPDCLSPEVLDLLADLRPGAAPVAGAGAAVRA
jgi:radical SAM superfamily enzyme